MVDKTPPTHNTRESSSYWQARYAVSPGSTYGLLRYERPEPDAARLGGPAQRGPQEGAAGALAPLTKSVDRISTSTDTETGEYQEFTRDNRRDELRRIVSDAERSATARTERYTLQRTARDILSWHDRDAPIRNGKRCLELGAHGIKPTNPWRVTFCSWRALEDPTVWKADDTGKAHFKGLAVCGSVWTCPVCAAKISQHRAQEIKHACDQHAEQGGSLVMCTLTFSHSREDDLKALIGDSKRSRGLRAALRRFRQSRIYRAFKEDTGIYGLVRNLEVTYGDAHGWHPHVHELWFLPYKLSDRALARLKSRLFTAWKDACIKSGLAPPNRKRGIDLLGVISPAEYMAKMGREQSWGVDAEMTRSHIKRGKFSSLTPFDLLRVASEGGARAGEARSRFVEYAHAFHGARQCYWTPGLKDRFGVQEVTDEDVARREAARSHLLTTISKATWKRALRFSFDVRGLILRLAETGGEPAIQRLLAPAADPAAPSGEPRPHVGSAVSAYPGLGCC